jgi:hypothetical protein
MPRLHARRLLAAAALSAGAITPLALGAAVESASARMCVHDHAFVKSTERGRAVWIPTNNHFSSPSNPSGWQQGGQQGYSESDGAQTSRSKGSADTAEAGGGLNFGIGNVSTKYNHQWNRSSTTGNSVTKTWSQSVSLPAGKISRMRIYQAGWRFRFTYVIVNDGGPSCKNQRYTRTAVLPTKAKVTAMLVELYANRGKTRPRG